MGFARGGRRRALDVRRNDAAKDHAGENGSEAAQGLLPQLDALNERLVESRFRGALVSLLALERLDEPNIDPRVVVTKVVGDVEVH